MTPVDLIRLALRDAGVNGSGQAPNDEDNNDAFLHLNMMLAQWNRKRWLVYRLRDVWKVATGNAIYVYGPGGDFDQPRTDKIEGGYYRYISNYGGADLGDPAGAFQIGVSQIGPEAQGYDQQFTILDSMVDFNRAVAKGVRSVPFYVYYDAAYPVAMVHFYPVPTAGIYELHLTVKAELTQFPDLTTDINLPPEYLEALLYNLGVRLRVAYQMPPDKTLMTLAAAALNTINGANTAIPRLTMPNAVPSGRSRFNIYAGSAR